MGRRFLCRLGRTWRRVVCALNHHQEREITPPGVFTFVARGCRCGLIYRQTETALIVPLRKARKP